jgi:anti-sigma regulatory factor (Ser/Thr protein kinase)
VTHVRLEVRDASQVGEARRAATAFAIRLGYDEVRAGTLALAVTEAATNLVRHARGGEILLGRVARGDSVGVEVYVLDRGPGIASVDSRLRDGVSTAGTPGLGLGSLARMTADFEVYSQPDKGTVMHFAVWPGNPSAALVRETLSVAAVCVPKAGETVSGDAWLVRAEKDRAVLLVVDGLGHGPDAAAAASAARRAVWDHWHRNPAEAMQYVHDALRPTRGAAAAIALLKPGTEVGTYCGVGNIVCRVHAAGASRHLVSHNGTLGHQARRMQEFAFPFPRNALLMAHTDGIATRWSLADYPGLEGRAPALIAGTLFRDHERGRDDATVVALRNICR